MDTVSTESDLHLTNRFRGLGQTATSPGKRDKLFDGAEQALALRGAVVVLRLVEYSTVSFQFRGWPPGLDPLKCESSPIFVNKGSTIPVAEHERAF
jgi:hypothetical protein